jgi:DNA-binding LytR/AlgR family response regulator
MRTRKEKTATSRHEIYVFMVRNSERLQHVLKIDAAVEDIINQLLKLGTEQQVSVSMTTMQDCGYNFVPVEDKYLFMYDSNKLKRVTITEIVYLEASRCYCEIHTANGKKTLVSLSLLETMAYLPEEDFVRVHRSHTVNMQYVEEIHGNKVILTGGIIIDIGREYRKSLIHRLKVINTTNKKYISQVSLGD